MKSNMEEKNQCPGPKTHSRADGTYIKNRLDCNSQRPVRLLVQRQ